jgi:hypothetical protein
MTRSITTVLMVIAALLAGVALAQPEEPEEPQDDEAAQEAAAPTPRAAERAPDEYEASEQISEDLAVSFPVDI